MPSYLLLRSNKQSGPFSKEQLLQLGLKPYDLVWVEGKSAAWRYTSEVTELKEYAPIVEEQPYDRFYKKQTDEQKEQESEVAYVKNIYEKPKEVKKEPEPEVVSVKNIYEKPNEEKYEQYLPKKNVSVIMPNQAPLKKEEPIFIPAPVKKEKPVFIPAPEASTLIAQKPAEVETKYSQPLDEIKEMYVKQLQRRKHKTAQKKFIIQSMKKAAVFVAIIGFGVLIGFAIKPKNSLKNNAVNHPIQNVSSEAPETSVKTETIQANNNDVAKIIETKQQPGNNNEIVRNELKSESAIIPDNKSSMVEKKKVDEEKDQSPINQQAPQTAINTLNGERNKNSRSGDAENEVNKKNIAGDISKSVSVKANNYKLKAFGGFQNLELTVSNDSKFTLDNVMVELQYLKLNEQPVKVEHIRFQSIEPGGSLTIRIPENKRGAKLFYRIIKIEPRDPNANTAGL